jgi:hypothetical protein
VRLFYVFYRGTLMLNIDFFGDVWYNVAIRLKLVCHLGSLEH